jgi:P2-related tail formation protein
MTNKDDSFARIDKMWEIKAQENAERRQLIQAENKGLSFKGTPEAAQYVIEIFNEAFYTGGQDAPNFIRDFVFNIEVALQEAGYLDENFNEVKP